MHSAKCIQHCGNRPNKFCIKFKIHANLDSVSGKGGDAAASQVNRTRLLGKWRRQVLCFAKGQTHNPPEKSHGRMWAFCALSMGINNHSQSKSLTCSSSLSLSAAQTSWNRWQGTLWERWPVVVVFSLTPLTRLGSVFTLSPSSTAEAQQPNGFMQQLTEELQAEGESAAWQLVQDPSQQPKKPLQQSAKGKLKSQ